MPCPYIRGEYLLIYCCHTCTAMEDILKGSPLTIGFSSFICPSRMQGIASDDGHGKFMRLLEQNTSTTGAERVRR